MAQALFEALAAGMPSMDTQLQTAMAVQSLLDSQTVTETPQAEEEEEDLFQCGKCKRQFNSLPTFVSHKQTRCTVQSADSGMRPAQQVTVVSAATNTNSGFSAASVPVLGKQVSAPVASFTQTVTLPQSALSQTATGQSVTMLGDELIFNNMEQNLQPAALQVGTTTIQGNPFLSQVSPLTPRSTGASTPPLATSMPAATSTSFTTGTAFTTALASPTLQMTAIQPQQLQMQTAQLEDSAETQAVVASSIETSDAKTLKLAPVETVVKSTSTTGRKLSSANSLMTNATAASNVAASLITIMPECLDSAQLAPMPAAIQKSGRTRLGAMANVDDASTKKKLRCQYCDKTFSKNFDLQQHIRSHTGEKPFQCIVCGRAFAQKSNVKKHMQTHKVWPQGQYNTLPEQPETLEGKAGDNATNSETKIPSGAQTMEIHVEGSRGITTNNLGISISRDERDDKKVVMIDSSYVCMYCNTKFGSYFQLKSHMVMHKEEQVYKCILRSCGQTFKDLDTFLEHTKTHEHEMSYRCHLCNKSFPSLYELGLHQYSHSLYPNQGPRPGPRYFRCMKCNSKYSTPESLQHHLETTNHSYPCIHCDKVFTCERYLRRHLPLHGTTGDYSCEVCSKQFKTEHYLKMHMLTHSSERPFKCDQCNAAFNRKDKLKRHTLIHEPGKKYRCPFRSHSGCMKEFNRPDKLKAHIISHSGIKPYKCEQCGKTFSRRPHLVEHQRKHKNDFTFTCEKCGRGFFRQKLMQMHKCRGPLPELSESPGSGGDASASANIGKTVKALRNSKHKGRPAKKKFITLTEETYKKIRESSSTRRRGRPSRAAARAAVTNIANAAAAITGSNRSASTESETEVEQEKEQEDSAVKTVESVTTLALVDPAMLETDAAPATDSLEGTDTADDSDAAKTTTAASADQQEIVIGQGNNMVIITPVTQGASKTSLEAVATETDDPSTAQLLETPSASQEQFDPSASHVLLAPANMDMTNSMSYPIGSMQTATLIPAGHNLATLVVDGIQRGEEYVCPDASQHMMLTTADAESSQPMVLTTDQSGIATVAYITTEQLEAYTSGQTDSVLQGADNALATGASEEEILKAPTSPPS